MPTYFVVYQQPVLLKNGGGGYLSWSIGIKTKDLANDTLARGWKDGLLEEKSVNLEGELYKRKLLRFAQEDGAHPRVLEGKWKPSYE